MTAREPLATATAQGRLTELDAEDMRHIVVVILLLREAYKALAAHYKQVLGTERHESRRIDNQLRGRCARQGDPGATRFFLSLNDTIFRIFGGDNIKQMMSMMSLSQPDDVPLERLPQLSRKS
eukprot:Skav200302  [mRNA]  locus=scaffold4329:81628:86211:- [translate_table: standard]